LERYERGVDWDYRGGAFLWEVEIEIVEMDLSNRR